MPWSRLFRKWTIPPWVVLMLTLFNIIWNIIQFWGDLDFLISDAKDWFWLINIVAEVLLSPFFALAGLLVGISWLILIFRQSATVGPTGTVVIRKVGRDGTPEGRGEITATAPVLVPEDEEIEKAAQADQAKEWRSLINDITEFAHEGNRAMEAYGRPQHLDSMSGLRFMNEWLSRVSQRLPAEYRVDFEIQGRGIFRGDAVWAEQLDIRLMRLREIVAEIRKRYL